MIERLRVNDEAPARSPPNGFAQSSPSYGAIVEKPIPPPSSVTITWLPSAVINTYSPAELSTASSN